MQTIYTPATLCFFSILTMNSLFGQSEEFNYDESKVPTYELPDPLLSDKGEPVTTASQWENKRRREVLERFRSEVYGRQPKNVPDILSVEFDRSDDALDGKAIRRQVRLHLQRQGEPPAMELLIYQPRQSTGPIPVFVGLNFQGNHTIHSDPAIRITENWTSGNTATDASRGMNAHRWQLEKVIGRGFAIATVYYGDIDPDFDDGWKNGFHQFFPMEDPVKPDAWGSIATWAWGLSRVLDFFEKDDAIDHQRVALLGHSRLGKTALWAGAEDERFSIIISNNSGCGGAALSRRRFGETVQQINKSFPHWFCDNFNKYNDNEQTLPVDQHLLIALIAPRPVYIASATDDRWADPHGEFLSGKKAESVYSLYGKQGLGVVSQPPPDTPVGNWIGYHLRTGKHDVTEYDWEQYLRFAETHFGSK